MAVTINASTSTGLVQSADTSGEIELQSNGTTALKVNTNEGIQILNCLGVGNATPSTSGAGITFPATQSASTDANTLDDYEEGTWTPSYGGSSSDPTVSYLQRNGRYVKIGQFVQVTAELQTSSVSGGSGALQIKGLPFAVLDSRYVGSGVTGYSNTFGTNAPRAGYCNTGGTNFLTLTYYNSASAQTESQISDLGTGSGANYLIFTATYRASA